MLSKLIFIYFIIIIFLIKRYETVDRTDPSARAQGERRAREENEERMRELRDKMEKDREQALREAKERALYEDEAQRMRLDKKRREREENARRLKEEEAFLQLKQDLMMYDFQICPRIKKESFTGLQVDDVDLIRIALIGPTGSGKTSFIGKNNHQLLPNAIIEDGQYHWVCLNSSWLLRLLRFGYKEQDFNYSDTVDSLEDTLGGKFSIRKAKSSAGYEREKKNVLSLNI